LFRQINILHTTIWLNLVFSAYHILIDYYSTHAMFNILRIVGNSEVRIQFC
jgi:hypothetical protein